MVEVRCLYLILCTFLYFTISPQKLLKKKKKKSVLLPALRTAAVLRAALARGLQHDPEGHRPNGTDTQQPGHQAAPCGSTEHGLAAEEKDLHGNPDTRLCQWDNACWGPVSRQGGRPPPSAARHLSEVPGSYRCS